MLRGVGLLISIMHFITCNKAFQQQDPRSMKQSLRRSRYSVFKAIANDVLCPILLSLIRTAAHDRKQAIDSCAAGVISVAHQGGIINLMHWTLGSLSDESFAMAVLSRRAHLPSVLELVGWIKNQLNSCCTNPSLSQLLFMSPIGLVARLLERPAARHALLGTRAAAAFRRSLPQGAKDCMLNRNMPSMWEW